MRLITSLKLFTLVVGSAGLIGLLPNPACALEDQDAKSQSLAHYTMGLVYDLQGETEKAIEQFDRSAKFEDSYAVHLRLGADYARLGKLDEAIKELNVVLKHDEQNVQARYLLALIYSTQKNFDKAAQQYEIILKSYSKEEPQNPDIYGYLGQLYYSQKQYKKAIEQFEKMLSLRPQDTDILFLLGSLYLEINDRPKAVEMFKKAIVLDPNNDNSLNSLGYLYAEDGNNLEEAQKLIEQAVKLDPKNGAYLDSLGWVYYKKGKYDEALKYLKEADTYMKDPAIYEHLGDVYYKLQQNTEAKKYWKSSLDMQPDQASVIKKLNSL